MIQYKVKKRKTYDSEKVRQLAANRRKLKAKSSDISDDVLQKLLGDLKAAGHLSITNFHSMNVQADALKSPGIELTPHVIKFYKRRKKYDDPFIPAGDAPDIVGYLQSASDADGAPYKLRGWFNQDGTIRIEVVK